MNLYAILAGVLLWGGSLAGTGWWFYGAGKDAVTAAEARDKEVVRLASDAAARVTAEAISKIEVKHVQIRQQLQTTVREVPVYRDCRHDPAGLQRLNDALTEPGAQPAGAGQLPAASAPGR